MSPKLNPKGLLMSMKIGLKVGRKSVVLMGPRSLPWLYNRVYTTVAKIHTHMNIQIINDHHLFIPFNLSLCVSNIRLTSTNHIQMDAITILWCGKWHKHLNPAALVPSQCVSSLIRSRWPRSVMVHCSNNCFFFLTKTMVSLADFFFLPRFEVWPEWMTMRWTWKRHKAAKKSIGAKGTFPLAEPKSN